MWLVVTHQEVEGEDGTVIEEPAWRVALRIPRSTVVRSISVEFAREIDAELARDALVRAGLDTEDRLRQAGLDTVRRIMLEALSW